MQRSRRLEPFLSTRDEEDDQGRPALCWCGELIAQLQCAPDTGRLYLTHVELLAWQGIDLPRQWDNPDRQPDSWPDVQLADFADRVRQALQMWEECLSYLCSSVDG
jgi:hypothetical protein